MTMETELLVNGKISPLGTGDKPVFSWRGDFDFIQTGYRLIIYSNSVSVFDSGYVKSSESQWIGTDFEPKSASRYDFEVILYDENNTEHKIGSSFFETALLNQIDWKASWICAGPMYRPNWAMYFRKDFTVTHEILYARLYFSGLGIGVPYINGKRTGDNKLDPAQSEYTERVYYSVYDITSDILPGQNCFGAELGDGWYSQNQLMECSASYGNPCLRAQINIKYKDGSEDTFFSDETFRFTYSPTVYNNIYIGETYDARLEIKGWNLPGFDDSSWFNAKFDNVLKGPMVSQFAQPIKVCREIKPVSINYPQEGVAVYDFGENLAGTVRLKLRGQPANRITVRFAETVDENGNPDYSSSGVFHFRGIQTLTYVFGNESVPGDLTITEGQFVYSGGKQIVWEPEFCYFGFRYAEITGEHILPDKETLTALKIHTAMPEKAYFESDYSVLNDMESLLKRTMPNNAQGLPTDCPAREKCGWTGDANVICESALIMWNSRDFWEKYTYDIRDSYKSYGQYFNVVPGKRQCLDTVPAWGCASIIIPRDIYYETGDINVLKRHFDDMEEYGKYLLEHSDNGIYENHIYKLADWAAPYGYRSENHFFEISSMYMYHSFIILKDCAFKLNKNDRAVFWENQALSVKKTIQNKYYNYITHTFGTQTLNAYGFYLGLIPAGEEKSAADWTEKDIIDHDWHITCGHIGIRYIYRYLDIFGRKDTLSRVLDSHTYPSFGAQLDIGATTLWETFELSTRNQSLDHPFRGSYCTWLYENVLGIRKKEPGYRSFYINPSCTVSGKIKGSVDTCYGTIESETVEGEYIYFTVPWNTKAYLIKPWNGNTVEYGPGKYKIGWNM